MDHEANRKYCIRRVRGGRKAGEGEHLLFDALKLLESANPNFFIPAISEAVLGWGSAHGVPKQSKTFWGAGYSPLYSRPVHRVEKQVLPFSCYLFYRVKLYWSGSADKFINYTYIFHIKIK